MKYQWITRGEGKVLVILAGWATDYRIFSGLPTHRPVMIIEDYDPFLLSEELPALFENEGVILPDLLGFSMGGYVALDFCLQYPEDFSHLILVGMRPKYPKKELTYFLNHLGPTKVKKLLEGFYQVAFVAPFYEIGTPLISQYLTHFSADQLRSGIEYLQEFGHLGSIDELPSDRVSFFHGREDAIAPFAELDAFLQERDFKVFCFEGAGHVLSDTIDVSVILECLGL